MPGIPPFKANWKSARSTRNCSLVCVLFIFALILNAQDTGTAHSQEPASIPPEVKQVLPSYEGQNVASVEVAGQPGINAAEVQPLLAQKTGQPFSTEKVTQTTAALKATGKFKDVQLQVVPDINGVRVLLVVQPGLYFGMYDFPGAADKYTYSRLLQIANYPPEGPYSDTDVQRAKNSLLKFYQRNGYFQARVEPTITTDVKYGIVNVAFNTEMGRKAKFGNVILQGTTPERTAQLQRTLKSVRARLVGSYIGNGNKFSAKTLTNATQYLENALMKEDHLGAKVSLIGANYDVESNRADVSFRIEEGPLIRVRVEGAHVWSWTRRKLLPVYQQVGVDQEIIQEGKNNLISHFQSKGFFDVNVDANVRKEQNGESIIYAVSKGPKHRVTSLDIVGNQALGEGELMPHVAVEKKRFIGHGKYSNKLVRDTVKNLEGIYRAAGFSTVKVVPQVKDDNSNLEVTFRVTEGLRDEVQSLKIDGNATMPEAQLAPRGFKVVAGQAYSQKLVDEDRNQIMAQYLRQGYLTATFRATAKPVNKHSHEVQVVYQIHEGPRVTTNDVITLGRNGTRQDFIDKTANIPTNKPMNEGEMLSAESRLFEPGIFDWAEVDPRRRITTQDREDIVVKVHEAKQNTITYGVGFEVINRGGSLPGGTVAVPGLPPVGLNKDFTTSEKTFYGPRGTVEYTRRNLRGKAETLTMTALAGRLDQRGSITFLDPHFRNTSWQGSVTLSGEHNSENPIFTSRQAESGFQLQKNLNAKKTQNLFLRYSLRETGLTQLLIPDLVPADDLHVRLSTLSATYVRDTRDNILDAKKGIYQSYEFAINPSFLGSNVDFGRFLGQTAYYKKIPKQIIWANSIRLGLEQPWNNSHVPVSEEFFSGGGSTLRGFPLNGAGPQRTIQACSDTGVCSPITVPVGGNELFILNSEFRVPVPIMKNLGVVGFYDGGNVFERIGFHGQYTNTFGAGLRYATPVGPLRLDIGHNLNSPPGVKAMQVFITLGQSF